MFLDSWYDSLNDPQVAQERALMGLVTGYRKTAYGKRCGVSEVSGIEGFRRNFPISSYDSFVPALDAIAEGRTEELLPEGIKGWVMTRGTTGPPKLFPLTDTHLRQILICGSRAVLNYARRSDDMGFLSRPVLNLGFPSNVGQLGVGGVGTAIYGYSSGTYARLNPGFGTYRLVPDQGEIDALGPGITSADWARRFEFIYERTKGLDVGSLIGVTQVMIAFARHVRRNHGTDPRELWNVGAVFCTSAPKIHVKYEPYIKRHYGDADVVEIYSATEGVFGQQLNEFPYFSPNYDTYVFEVQTGKGCKMLHELRRGEWGRLIISSCIFPRYDIGDLVESYGHNYFRIMGRASVITALEHRAHRALTWWL
jgi:hypothetical protein